MSDQNPRRDAPAPDGGSQTPPEPGAAPSLGEAPAGAPDQPSAFGPQYEQPQYAQPHYTQPQYQQAPCQQAHYGQMSSGPAPYGQEPYGHAPSGQTPYGQPSFDQSQAALGYPQPGPPSGPQGPFEPQAPYGRAQDPFGQQPAYGQAPYAQPHGQPQYAQQGYSYQPGGYPRVGPAWQQPAPRSDALGLVALIIVGVCTVLVSAAGWAFGSEVGAFVLKYGIEATETFTPSDAEIQEMAVRLTGWSWALVVGTVAGLVGWILSIVAASRRQGRQFAVPGIVLGILAPFIAFIVMAMAMAPAIEALP